MLKEFSLWLLVAYSICQIHWEKNDIWQFQKNTKLQEVQKLFNEMEKHKKALSCLCDMVKKDHREYPKQGAAIYIRWGRTTCPGNGTKLIYSGNQFNSPNYGRPSNYLCLPKNPDWAKYQDSDDKVASSKIYRTEYETHSHTVGEALDKSRANYEVSCAVCQNTIRSGVYMLPEKTTCFPGWQLEYKGYLMSGHTNNAASEYIFVDANPEHIDSNVVNCYYNCSNNCVCDSE